MATLLKLAEKAKTKNNINEQILLKTYQNLRLDQRRLVTKLTEYEAEDNEVKIVIKTLNEVDQGRKCFRLIGGTLYEKTVKDILPALNKRKEELNVLIESTKTELTNKMKEIEKLKEDHKPTNSESVSNAKNGS